jgi:hypothetical protein
LDLTPKDIKEIIEKTADGVVETRPLLSRYISDHPSFVDIGESMLKLWEQGLREICPPGVLSP